MPCGDYVPCPRCRDGCMIWGQVFCSRCEDELRHAPKLFMTASLADVRGTYADKSNTYQVMPEKSLNELADDVIGKAEETLTRVKPHARQLFEDMGQLFDQLFSDPKEQPNKYKDTLVVNLFAGPGTGKSTAAAGVFFDLKNKQINTELASEYAKDLVWEKRNFTFEDQLYLFAKQHHRIFNLLGQVDVVITDCPILLSPVYDSEKRRTFERLVVEEHNRMWTYNVFLKRHKTYNPKGRIHNEQQAHEIDRKVLDVLDRNHQAYETFDATPEGKDKIVKKILMLLEHKKNQQYFKPMPRTEKVRISLPPKPHGK
jgi:hypothetical protein